MELYFQGGGESATLFIDRNKKEVKVSSSKTNFKAIKADWKMLFDKGKEELQESITDKLEDKMFIKAIERGMNRAGYELINSKC